MNPPRLLIVGSLPPPYSGYETATEVLLNSGLDKSFKVKFVDTRTTRDPSSRGKVNVSNILVTAIVWWRLFFSLVVFRPHLANVPLAQNRAGFLKWLILACSCKVFGARVVSRLGGSSFREFYECSGALMRCVIRAGLKIPSKIIVRGASLKSQFNGLVSIHNIVVVPNGFDVSSWNKGFVKERRDEGKLHVLYLGQVSKAKGVFDLIEAIALLKREDPEGFTFKIAGPVIERERNILHVDSPESTSAAIRDMLDAHSISPEDIEFLGEVSWDEKRRLYEWADVLVLPSYSEGFPYTVLEAFASSCVVVCTPVGALPDFLSNQEQVLFVSTHAPSEILNALVLLKEEKIHIRLLKRARSFLEKNHGLEVFSSRMVYVFNDALNMES